MNIHRSIIDASKADRPIEPPHTSDIADCELIVMGMFPPPVTGAAKNLLLMQEEMVARGVRTAIIDTGIHKIALSRSLGYHAKRMSHFLKTMAGIRRIGNSAGPAPVLYCVPDGGLGLWYTYAYLRAAAGKVRRVVIHHRTFQYIDEFSGAMRRICCLKGVEVVHVFLSRGMAEKFQTKYGPIKSYVSTNARYVTPRSPKKPEDHIVIGHLSNLCAGKGFFEVADTFEAAVSEGMPVRLELAGPVLENEVRARLDQLLAQHGSRVTYHGPLSGKNKDDFYDRVHVFLFPTHWKQEAQPNVVYEAFAGGAAVIAYGRGCIPEQLNVDFGYSVRPGEDFAPVAVKVMSAWSQDGGLQTQAAQVTSHLAAERGASLMQYETLLELLER